MGRATEKRRLTLEVETLRNKLRNWAGIEAALLGRSPLIEQVRHTILDLANTSANVVVIVLTLIPVLWIVSLSFKDPSSITDFDGVVAVAHGQGHGVGTDASLRRMDLVYDVDMRFMQGRYRATDGRVRTATFGFI